MLHTIMLADKSLVYSMTDSEFVTTEKGCYVLRDEFVKSLAESAAKLLKGTLVRTWYDNNAGGYFAEIEV